MKVSVLGQGVGYLVNGGEDPSVAPAEFWVKLKPLGTAPSVLQAVGEDPVPAPATRGRGGVGGAGSQGIQIKMVVLVGRRKGPGRRGTAVPSAHVPPLQASHMAQPQARTWEVPCPHFPSKDTAGARVQGGDGVSTSALICG